MSAQYTNPAPYCKCPRSSASLASVCETCNSERLQTAPAGEAHAEASSSASLPPMLDGGVDLDFHKPVPPSDVRRIAWLNREKGHLLTDDGAKIVIRKNASLAIILSALPDYVQCCYLIGKTPGGIPSKFAVWLKGKVPAGFVENDSWLVGGRPIGRYEQGHRNIEIRLAKTWWPKAGNCTEARNAWLELQKVLAARFGAAPMSTPAETGKMLLQASWKYHKGERPRPWPNLPGDVQKVIREATTQGRSEFLALPEVDHKQVVEVDGRFMYAKFLDEIAHAPAFPITERLTERDFLKDGSHYFQPGLYRVRFAVPADWNHIGILPERGPDGWTWPSTPGYESGDVWCDVSELYAAAKYDWFFDVHEGFTYSRRQGIGAKGPLREWGHQLTSAEQEAVGEVNAMIRSIVRTTIGALSPSPYKAKRSVSIENAREAPDIAEIEVIDDELIWTELVERTDSKWSHPEWNRQIWARCRAAVTKYALTLPRESILAIETDALFLTEAPQLPPATKAGQFRVKRRLALSGSFSDSASFRKAVAHAKA